MKKVSKKTLKPAGFMVCKEVKFDPYCKKNFAAPKKSIVKNCEIQYGSQEMTLTVAKF